MGDKRDGWVLEERGGLGHLTDCQPIRDRCHRFTFRLLCDRHLKSRIAAIIRQEPTKEIQLQVHDWLITSHVT